MNRKGISLIVLVITIIIMIILAAAVIISLTNSGIIKNAKQAREDSDNASLKEAAEIAYAEWDLENGLGKTSKTASDYVKDKLTDQGLDGSRVIITEDGELVIVGKSLDDKEIRIVEAKELNLPQNETISEIYTLKNQTFYFSTTNQVSYEMAFYYYNGTKTTKINVQNSYSTRVYETKDNKVYFADGNGSIYKLSGSAATRLSIPENVSEYSYFEEINNTLFLSSEYAGVYIINDTAVTKIFSNPSAPYLSYSEKYNAIYLTDSNRRIF